MAYMQLDFSSQYLGGSHPVSIILPERPDGMDAKDFYSSGKKYKVLWLLHGSFDDHTAWVRKSNIEVYACEKDLIVVMPNALNSNYANWPEFGLGYNMYDYLFEELMPLVYNWLPASQKREDNYIAGLSMGGRGTCVYAFNHPENSRPRPFSPPPRGIWMCSKRLNRRCMNAPYVAYRTMAAWKRTKIPMNTHGAW